MVQVKISDYIIGIIIFTLFIVGGVSMLAIFTSHSTGYGNSTAYVEYNDTVNVLGDVTNQVEELESSVKSSDPDWGVLGTLNALINSGWQTLKLTFDSFNFMDEVFIGTSAFFGIPLWIPGIIILIITIIIVFAIYSAIFQREL